MPRTPQYPLKGAKSLGGRSGLPRSRSQPILLAARSGLGDRGRTGGLAKSNGAISRGHMSELMDVESGGSIEADASAIGD